MVKIAVIAEFNPFHNGHEFLAQTIKKEYPDSFLFAVMSGDFCQRGIPAVCDKFTRTKWALENGFDCVFELPVRFSTASAPDFALGAVLSAHEAGCNVLYFACEEPNTDRLEKLAGILADEPPELKTRLNELTKCGRSYPAALSQAVNELYKDYKGLLDTPNNTLAVEYIKAVRSNHFDIECKCIKRIVADHHETRILEGPDSKKYTSATTIRKAIENAIYSEDILAACPSNVLSSIYQPVFEDDFSLLLSDSLCRLSHEEMEQLADSSPDLAHSLKNAGTDYSTFSKTASKVYSKTYTLARVQRVLLHSILSITEDMPKNVTYLRLLGFKTSCSKVIKEIAAASAVPVITKPSSYKADDPLYLKDLYAADLYSKILSVKYKTGFVNDIKKTPVRI